MEYFELMASVFVLAQLFFYGRKSLFGPIFGIVATVMWIGIGLHHDILSLWVLNVCLLIQSVVNFFRWYCEKYPVLDDCETRTW